MKARVSVLLKPVLVLLMLMAAWSVRAQYDIDQFFARGQRALMEGEYTKAINNFNILIRLNPNLYEAWFFRGIGKYNLGDFPGAESDFDKALDINPVYTMAYHYRAITRSRLGHYDEAIEDLQRAVELRPDYFGLYFSRGVTYFLSQQFEKAVDDFNRFISHEPRDPDAYLNRGASYLFLKDTVSALRDYNHAITLRGFDPEGYVRRSRIYYAQHRYEEALNDLDRAIELDTSNTFAYFNRALIRYELNDIQGTLSDFDEVLSREPDNSLTLYNRALIRSQIGDYNNALDDYDRVLDINPENVLAYYNRSILFMETGRWQDAMDDLSSAIELYPDFANAYMNRSYVKNQLGQYASAQEDYRTAQAKISRYRSMTSDSAGRVAFADTTRKYDRLLALDSDFARSDFNDELLQNRNVNINLRPLYRFVIRHGEEGENIPIMLSGSYDDSRMTDFAASVPLDVEISCRQSGVEAVDNSRIRAAVEEEADRTGDDRALFAKALMETESKQYNAAMESYSKAIDRNPGEVFYYINRGALQAEMIDFISSIESNVQVLTMDNAGTAKARVRDGSIGTYDYSAAIGDMNRAADIYPEFPYTYYNLGNLYCLSGNMPEAITQYTKAVGLYPGLAEAYYNRGLVLIYVRDKEKGCLDLSKAGELGIDDAYSVISRYCDREL